jgi:hypothetical protein
MLMIGVLCSHKMNKGYAELLHSIYKKSPGQKSEKLIVFTISNIDITGRKVKGSLVTADKIKHINAPMPSVIFNMSIQRDREGIKKQRELTEVDGLTLINNVNRFDQSMIMEMLSSSRKASEYLLPFHVYNKAKRDFKPDDEKSYIAMPARGTSMSRIIYALPESNKDSVGGSQYFKKGHICDYIDASMCQKRWIFMELPDILDYNNYPIVLRAYLQRVDGDTWSVLGRSVHPGIEFPLNSFSQKLDEASLTIVNQVNKFMPSLGHCFIDFVISADLRLYVLHLGGLNHYFLNERQSEDFYSSFYKNMLDLSGYCGRTQKGV